VGNPVNQGNEIKDIWFFLGNPPEIVVPKWNLKEHSVAPAVATA
jgi:hypothetical protein